MSEVYSGDFISWLRSFYQVAETRSFSRTAELVGRTQSTVTYQLKKLEERLGVVLVNRKVSPLELTPEGIRLYDLCHKLFDVLQELQSEVRAGDEVQGDVSIAANYGMVSYFLPKRIAEFKKLYPKVNITTLPLPIDGLIKAYHGPDVDILITQRDVLPPEAKFYTLFEADIALVTPSSWNVELSDPPKVEDFAHFPFIAFWRDYPFDRRVESAIQEAGYTLKVEQYAGFFLPVLTHVALGRGVAIMDAFQASTSGMPIKVHTLSGVFPHREYGIGYRPRQYISPQTRRFMDYLLSSTPEENKNMLQQSGRSYTLE